MVRERHEERARRGVRSLLLEVMQAVRRERAKEDTVGFIDCMNTGLFRGKHLHVHREVQERVRKELELRGPIGLLWTKQEVQGTSGLFG